MTLRQSGPGRAIADSVAAETPFAPQIVEEVLRLLGKAARAQQLYLPNNPVYRGAVDAVRTAFAPVWANTDELALTISETELKWAGATVYREGPRNPDNLAWMFHKDGIREVRLVPGFEHEELVRFLDVIRRARTISADTDDLVTMLWESEFAHLTYRYVDLVVDDVGQLTAAEAALKMGGQAPADPEAVRDAVKAAAEQGRAGGFVNVADFDPTLFFLSETEVEYIHSEVAREYSQDLRSNVVSALLDTFEQQTDAAIRDEITAHLESMLVYQLTTGSFRGVVKLLQEVQVTAGRAVELGEEQRTHLLGLADRLSSAEALDQLLRALDDAPVLPPQDELTELFWQLRANALGTVFSWLARARTDRVRRLLEVTAERLAVASAAELVKLIGSDERTVSDEAVRRAGALKTLSAVSALARILGDGDAKRRLLAAEALVAIGQPTALQALERAVEDRDRDVRLLAAKALGARGHRAALPRLEAAVKGKALREADLTEKMAFFEAYGALAGDAGVAYLQEVLNGKGFLGKREDAEIRACAAVGLGRIRTPAAIAALQQAQSESNVVIRNAVTRALKGGAA